MDPRIGPLGLQSMSKAAHDGPLWSQGSVPRRPRSRGTAAHNGPLRTQGLGPPGPRSMGTAADDGPLWPQGLGPLGPQTMSTAAHDGPLWPQGLGPPQAARTSEDAECESVATETRDGTGGPLGIGGAGSDASESPMEPTGPSVGVPPFFGDMQAKDVLASSGTQETQGGLSLLPFLSPTLAYNSFGNIGPLGTGLDFAPFAGGIPDGTSLANWGARTLGTQGTGPGFLPFFGDPIIGQALANLRVQLGHIGTAVAGGNRVSITPYWPTFQPTGNQAAAPQSMLPSRQSNRGAGRRQRGRAEDGTAEDVESGLPPVSLQGLPRPAPAAPKKRKRPEAAHDAEDGLPPVSPQGLPPTATDPEKKRKRPGARWSVAGVAHTLAIGCLHGCEHACLCERGELRARMWDPGKLWRVTCFLWRW